MTNLAPVLLLLGLLVAGPVQAQTGPAPTLDPDSLIGANERDASAPVAPQAREQELRVDVGGYGAFRYEVSNDVTGSVTLRRFVITTDARWGDRLQAYSEVEYERLSEIEIERGVDESAGGLTFEQEIEGTNGSELALEQAWAQLQFGSVGARVGAILPPVGRFNLSHDDNLWNFPRRPLVDRGAQVLPVPAAWTEMGFGLVGEHHVGEEALLSWQGYLVNGVTLDFVLEEKISTRAPQRDRLLVEAQVGPTQGAFDGSNTADAVTGRLSFSPTLGSELAVSGYTGPYTPDFLDVAARLTTLGLDGRTRLGPVVAEAELLYTTYGNLDAVVTDFARVARDHSTETARAETAELETEIEIALNGLAEHRGGFWVDLSWPIALASGTMGFESAVLAPVARYERVRFDQSVDEVDFADGRITRFDQSDREQERFAIGLAFRPLPQAVLQLVYERNRAVEGSMIDPGTGERISHGFVAGLAVGF